MRINCHCHIFSLDCVPHEFRKRFMLDVKNPFHRIIQWLVRKIIPENCNLKAWMDFLSLSVSEIAKRLVQEMDEAGIDIAVPLMMDMELCKGFEGPVKSFQEQMKDTAEAVKKVNEACGRTRILPFIAADPRRKGVSDIVIDALEEGTFKGVKIYPVMGFLPDDPRLYPIYQYCMENQIPITSHCQNGGIPGLDKYYHLAHPRAWLPVLGRFPQLKLNLAHNDHLDSGNLSWQPLIADLIMKFPNVYTDCSYNTEMMYRPRRYFMNMKRMLNTPKIRDTLLYGTDWYMGRCFWTEASYLKWFTEYAKTIPWCRVEFTGEEIKRMTQDNPGRFLGLN